MRISMMVAIGLNREIGLNNALLWKLPNDMRHFKSTTMGKPIVMGRKTFESFGAKPLPGRKNIIITRDKSYQSDGVFIAHNVEQALELCGDASEMVVIGGAEIYTLFMSRANRLYITQVAGQFEADTWFPKWEPSQWVEKEKIQHPQDEKHAYSYAFVTLDRIE